jgi:hypothetical protein
MKDTWCPLGHRTRSGIQSLQFFTLGATQRLGLVVTRHRIDTFWYNYGCAKNPTWQVSDEQICPLVFSLGFNLMLSLQSQHKVLKVPSLFTVILWFRVKHPLKGLWILLRPVSSPILFRFTNLPSPQRCLKMGYATKIAVFTEGQIYDRASNLRFQRQNRRCWSRKVGLQ